VVGVAITPVVPTNAGGAATSTTVTTGALPGGVSVAADGTVSGTPLAAGSGSAKMTGANAVGTGPESNAMSWTVAAAPPEVTYDENPDTPGAADIRDTVDYAPVSVGGPFTSAAYLSGDDPADFGLTIDDETGHITGELNAIGTVSFVVRFTGPGGTVDAPFELDVSDIAPVITYTPQFYFNVPNNKLPGTGTGGTIPATGAYTKVSGDYPTGISNINADTGALAGTPTVLGETGTLVLRATNAIGDGDFTLNWVVTPPEDEDGDFGEDEAWDQMTSDGTKSIGSSAAVIVAARPGRTRLVVQNRHATQDLFLGPTGAVSSTAFAWKLTAGQSRDLGAYTGALYGYGSGAATTCTALEGYTAR
jgi:hypothetical protein